MQKLALFAGAVVMALGVSAASSSAFAMGCLDNQPATTSLSQANSLASYTGGSESSLTNQYASVGQGAYADNACPVTQQSLPIDQQQHHNGHQNTAY